MSSKKTNSLYFKIFQLDIWTCSTKAIEQKESRVCLYLSVSASIFLSLVSMCANCPFSAIYYSFSHSNLNWNSPLKDNSLSSDSS